MVRCVNDLLCALLMFSPTSIFGLSADRPCLGKVFERHFDWAGDGAAANRPSMRRETRQQEGVIHLHRRGKLSEGLCHRVTSSMVGILRSPILPTTKMFNFLQFHLGIPDMGAGYAQLFVRANSAFNRYV